MVRTMVALDSCMVQTMVALDSYIVETMVSLESWYLTVVVLILRIRHQPPFGQLPAYPQHINARSLFQSFTGLLPLSLSLTTWTEKNHSKFIPFHYKKFIHFPYSSLKIQRFHSFWKKLHRPTVLQHSLRKNPFLWVFYILIFFIPPCSLTVEYTSESELMHHDCLKDGRLLDQSFKVTITNQHTIKWIRALSDKSLNTINISLFFIDETEDLIVFWII